MNTCIRFVTAVLSMALLPPDARAAPNSPVDGLRLLEFQTGVTRPVAVRHAGDGSGRLFIVQQDGIVRVRSGSALLATPFLTLDATSTQCASVPGGQGVALGFHVPVTLGDERGLLGMDFHPAFETNGFVFVSFSDGDEIDPGTGSVIAGSGDTAIVRYHVPAGGNTIDPSTCRIVLRIDQDFNNHNGGDIHFGPDGFLYIGMGDGGAANDPCTRSRTLDPALLVEGNVVTPTGQTRNCSADAGFVGTGDGNPDSRALLGKFLRIDVDATTPPGGNGLCASYSDGSAGYAAPPSNPFAGADPVSGCDEVWSYGWRNPWRFSFDRQTSDLWVGDVGQNAVEEVDLERAGAAAGGDYGWKFCEGDQPANGGDCNAPKIAPVLTYTHSNGRCSIAGGYRWRGSGAFHEGAYFYGDSCTSEFFVARETAPGSFTSTLWTPAAGSLPIYGLVAFGEAEDGRIFAVDHGAAVAGGGRVLEIEAALFVDSFE